jgi:CBS domain-containing protein
MVMIQNILDRKGGEVITIRATETVKSAADRMREHGIAALAVKSGDVIKGLISERDIVQAVSQHGEGALSMAVLDVATHAIVTVAPGDSLKRAMSLMTNHRVRHLPVIANGNLVGIVSMRIRNTVAALLESLPDDLKGEPSAKLLGSLADRKVYNMVHLIYRAKNYEGNSKL